jgi:hypothetical protein
LYDYQSGAFQEISGLYADPAVWMDIWGLSWTAFLWEARVDWEEKDE